MKQVKNADGSILYTLKTKAGRVFDILNDAKGFPVFEKTYQMTLDAADLLKSRATHFSRVGKDLYQKVLADSNLMKKFTKAEIATFKSGKVPERWTWHHHKDTGVMQLALKEVHEVASHTGGFSIWGHRN